MSFSDRLVEAFGGASMADIARRLNVPHSTIRNYVQQGRLPSAEVLIEIANRTNVSLTWLLTGKERKSNERATDLVNKRISDKLQSIAREQARTVFGDAEIAGQNVDEATLRLLTEYLLDRALASVNLIEEGALLSKQDRKRAERFSFVRDLEPTIEEKVKQLVRAELSKAVGGEVGEMEPADRVGVRHLGTVSGGEEEEKIRKAG